MTLVGMVRKDGLLGIHECRCSPIVCMRRQRKSMQDPKREICRPDTDHKNNKA